MGFIQCPRVRDTFPVVKSESFIGGLDSAICGQGLLRPAMRRNDRNKVHVVLLRAAGAARGGGFAGWRSRKRDQDRMEIALADGRISAKWQVTLSHQL